MISGVKFSLIVNNAENLSLSLAIIFAFISSLISLDTLFTIFTEQMYRAAELPANFGFLPYSKIFAAEAFGPGHLVDHIHLKPFAQDLVADYLMQLDKPTDPIPAKKSEGGALVPFSEILQGEGIMIGLPVDEEEYEEEESPAVRARVVCSVVRVTTQTINSHPFFLVQYWIFPFFPGT